MQPDSQAGRLERLHALGQQGTGDARQHVTQAGAGLGDVLSGITGALLAQRVEALEAACLAVWLHAAAGQRLGAQGRGLAATDLIPTVRQLLEECSPCLK